MGSVMRWDVLLLLLEALKRAADFFIFSVLKIYWHERQHLFSLLLVFEIAIERHRLLIRMLG